MSDELLRHPTHNGHLFVGALKRHKDRPVLFLGDTTLTGGQLADKISQHIQAFEALGAGTDSAVALLSLNRPEVLMIIGAGQTRGYRRTALHPLGSLDDHAYRNADQCCCVQLAASKRRMGRPVVRFCGFRRRTLSVVMAAIT